jgi:hypothetical protein
MNMNRLNVFRRLDELETANMHLQVVLKSARHEIECLRALMRLQVKPKAAPAPAPKAVRTKDALNAVVEKKREYARKYYAKKKAAKLAAMEAAKLAAMEAV